MGIFVVAGIQRTGTNYLRTLLDSHKDIRCYGEIFLKSNKNSFSYRSYRRQSKTKYLRSIVFTKITTTDYLNEMVGDADCSMFGFKFMVSQHLQNPYVIEYLKEKSGKLVVMERKNILATLVSRKIARKYNVFHSKEHIESKSIRLEPDHVISDLTRIENENAALNAFLQVVESKKLYYEDLVENNHSTISSILDFLEISPDSELKSEFKKVNSSNFNQTIENYPEVEIVLRKSKFAKVLE